MVLAAFLVLLGGFVLYRGVRELRHLRKLRREGHQVVGTVTHHERRSPGTRSVVVSYTDDRGATHQLTSSFASSRPAIEVGETVAVRYLPGDPAGASLDEGRENVRSAVLYLVIGLGFPAAGVSLALKGD
ncbi:hypothetical protein AFR_11735 [Actinoplanes friuliensis DSM 7358]|uniref:DUF3592 domain-containing protein n=2 Tax=Actinoplanes friuliensis TaxID=196914 RepID=U5VYC0_9ACTN|nr:hypothetical protein AFR_11735 [Actinoplanes friuliensis DSM 7358]